MLPKVLYAKGSSTNVPLKRPPIPHKRDQKHPELRYFKGVSKGSKHALV